MVKIISIEGDFGKEVAATLVTPFLAVHRAWEGTEWNVTHVPTGRKIGDSYRLKKQAMKVAKALAALPLDWAAPTDAEIRKSMAQTNTTYDMILDILANPY